MDSNDLNFCRLLVKTHSFGVVYLERLAPTAYLFTWKMEEAAVVTVDQAVRWQAQLESGFGVESVREPATFEEWIEAALVNA